MVFFPDNQKRANRLQQLVDSMANMQTDVKDIGDKMDAKNAQYRPAIDALLRKNNMATIDDLIAAAASRMTPQERAVFEALIKTARASKSGFDIAYLVGSLLMVPEGVVLTGSQAISIAGWGSRMVGLKNIANFCKASRQGTQAAAEAASEIATDAEDAEKGLQGTSDASEAGQEAAKAAALMGRIGTFLKVLGGVGLVITLISGIIELVQGSEQKAKLIAAIHALQPARLITAFYKQEGTSIMNVLESLDDYLDALPGGSEPDADYAARAKRIILHIQTDNAAIDLGPLEDDLEGQDRSSGLFYGGDDLSRDQVIADAEQAQSS